KERNRYDAAAWEVCEKYADGLASKVEFDQYLPAMRLVGGNQCARKDAWYIAAMISAEGRRINSDRWEKRDILWMESVAQAALVREIFGNPFRRVGIARGCLSWHDRTIPRLAQSIYVERAYDQLPILADALEDAGCTDADILAHCRNTEPHVRG